MNILITTRINKCLTGLLFILLANVLTAQSVHDTLTPVAKGNLLARATTVKLKRGTEVVLHLDEPLDSRSAQKGQVVRMSVYGDVVVDGDILIKTNLEARGIVTEIEQPKRFGRPARLTVEASSVQAVDGSLVPLRGMEISPVGKSRKIITCLGAVAAVAGTAAGVPVALLFLGSGFLEKGSHVCIENNGNLLFKARVSEDVMIKG